MTITSTAFKETELGRLPEDWSIKTTEDILLRERGSLKIGPFGSQLKREYFTSKGYKVYGQENVFKSDFSIGQRYINKERFEFLKSCELKENDLLISMMGTIGQAAIAPKGIEDGIIDSHLIRLRVDESVFDRRFLLYLFRSRLIQDQLDALAVGTIMSGLSSGIIRQLKFPCPPCREQHAIARLLGSFDDKIELNRQMNRTLEQIAQALFKFWFVDFDPVRAKGEGRWKEGESLPGMPADMWELWSSEFEKSGPEQIPRGWKLSSLSQVCSLVTDGAHFSPREEPKGPKRIATVKDMGSVDFNIENCKSITNADYQKLVDWGCRPEKGDILLSKDGTMGLVHLYSGHQDVVLLSSIAILRPLEGLSEFLWLYLLDGTNRQKIVTEFSSGSVLRRLVVKDIKRIPVIVPPKNILVQFATIVQPIHRRLISSRQESRVLTSLRDTLLPKLLSGEIRVFVGSDA